MKGEKQNLAYEEFKKMVSNGRYVAYKDKQRIAELYEDFAIVEDHIAREMYLETIMDNLEDSFDIKRALEAGNDAFTKDWKHLIPG